MSDKTQVEFNESVLIVVSAALAATYMSADSKAKQREVGIVLEPHAALMLLMADMLLLLDIQNADVPHFLEHVMQTYQDGLLHRSRLA